MGATHSSSRDLHHGSNPSSGFTIHKGRASFSKERLRSHSNNSIHTPTHHYNQQHKQPQMHYPCPNNSASTLNSNHYLSPASPSHSYHSNSHPQYRNHHHSAPIHNSSSHRQGSISPPSSNASSNTSSTLQKAISRRRASSQTVESNISSSYGSTLASSPDRQHTYLPKHSGECAGGFGHLQHDDHQFRWYHGRRYHNSPSLYMLPNDTEEVD
ncbi:hypothetical protein BGZ97_008512, partial [Linnemannia gamsii]